MDFAAASKTKLHHIIKSQQFDIDLLQKLFYKTGNIKSQFKNPAGRTMLRRKHEGKLLFNVFYEPSTRTRYSFAAAANHLGMQVVDTENAKQFSSAIKGESIEDTIQVLAGYHPDAIVLRHHEAGAAHKAALISPVPIINAGDGAGQHPTQALLDVFTIYNRMKKLNDLCILVGGDLAYGRTVRSLVYLLSKFKGNSFVFCSPEPLMMFPDIKEHLEEIGAPYVEVTQNLHKALPHADIVYWTRIQRERITDPTIDIEKVMEQFVIDQEALDIMKPYSVLLHPLPRNKEIARECDDDIRSAYFEQAANGMYVRMALLDEILTKNSF